MNSTIRRTDARNPRPVSITTGHRSQQRAGRPITWRPAAEPTGRRFNRVTVGFWLGALALGTGGCLLGACLPYRHPAAVPINILWWGIYLGCLGAWIGAGIGSLFGRRWNDPPVSRRAGAGRQRPQDQAAPEAAALADRVGSPVLDDRKGDSFIGGLGI